MKNRYFFYLLVLAVSVSGCGGGGGGEVAEVGEVDQADEADEGDEVDEGDEGDEADEVGEQPNSDSPRETEDPNHAPIVQNLSPSYSVVEGQAVVTTMTATDPDGDAIRASLGGADASSFKYDASNTAISFKAPPDHEAPADVDADGIYELTISVSDGSFSVDQTLSVTVVNDLTVDILTPLPGTNVGGVDEYQVLVEVSDPEDASFDGSSLSAVKVNGIVAFPFKDTENIWSARLLLEGKGSIIASAEVSGQPVIEERIDVWNLAPVVSPEEIVIDEVRGNLLVLENDARDVIWVAGDGSSSRVFLHRDSLRSAGFRMGGVDTIAIDTDGDQLVASTDIFGVDDTYGGTAIVSVALDTGDVTIVSGGSKGAGPPLDSLPRGIDTYQGQVIVPGSQSNRLFAVDLQTGDRRIVSGGLVGSGPLFEDPEDVAVDPASGTAFVMEVSPFRILAVSIASGDRKIVSSITVGAGPAPDPAYAMLFDAANSRLLVTAYKSLLQVDPLTGTRSLLRPELPTLYAIAVSSAGKLYGGGGIDGAIYEEGNGLILNTALGGGGRGLSSANDMVYSVEKGAFYVLGIEIKSLDPRFGVVSGPCDECGEFWLWDMDLDEVGSRLFLTERTDASEERLRALDVVTGELSTVSGAGVGSGPAFISPIDIEYVEEGSVAYVLEAPDQLNSDVAPRVLKVDVESGSRSIISSNSMGSGEALVTPAEMAYLNAQKMLILADTQESDSSTKLVAVEVKTGDRKVVYTGGDGSGPAISDVTDMISVSDREVAVLDWDNKSLVLVNVLTGEGRVLSGPERGDGALWKTPRALGYDTENDRYYVVDRSIGSLFAVDNMTGNRTIVITKH